MKRGVEVKERTALELRKRTNDSRSEGVSGETKFGRLGRGNTADVIREISCAYLTAYLTDLNQAYKLLSTNHS